MAKVVFSALIEEIIGKLAGSVFQDSYQGFQIRTRVTPRNPRSYYQQLRRGEFGYITSLWRTLTSAERQTWLSLAGSPGPAFNAFVHTNVNLSLLNIAPVKEWQSHSPGTAPIPTVIQSTPSAFLVSATDPGYTLSADTSLIVHATYQREPQQVFNNKSMFSPIATFPSPFSPGTPFDILPQWKDRFGDFLPNKRQCIYFSVVSQINGSRNDSIIACSESTPVLTNKIVDNTGNALIDADGTLITFP